MPFIKNIAILAKKTSVPVEAQYSLWGWGGNASGEIGLGDITDRSSPVQVGTLTNWYSVSVGRFQTMAIKTDGTLWAWGSNGSGRLGLGDITDRSSPVQVGALTNWYSVDLGNSDHTMAIKEE